jgi:hypothetical protein
MDCKLLKKKVNVIPAITKSLESSAHLSLCTQMCKLGGIDILVENKDLDITTLYTKQLSVFLKKHQTSTEDSVIEILYELIAQYFLSYPEKLTFLDEMLTQVEHNFNLLHMMITKVIIFVKI